MQSTTRRLTLVPAGQHIRQGWVLLGLLALLALLVLFGAGMGRSHSTSATSGGHTAASNGDIVIGTTMVAPIEGQLAATTGDVRVGNGG